MKQVSLVLGTLFILASAYAQSWGDIPDIPEAMTYPVVVLEGQIHIMGRQVYQDEIQTIEGESLVHLRDLKISPSFYILNLSSNKDQFVQKIWVE